MEGKNEGSEKGEGRKATRRKGARIIGSLNHTNKQKADPRKDAEREIRDKEIFEIVDPSH